MGVVVGIREEKKAKQRPSLRSTPAQSLEGGDGGGEDWKRI